MARLVDAAPLLFAAVLALGAAPAAAQEPPPGPTLPAPPGVYPGSYLPPRSAMRPQDPDMVRGGIALLIAGGIGMIVGTSLLVRSEGGLSLTREVGGALAFTAAGLSFIGSIPLLVIGGKEIPATDVRVGVGLGSVKVLF